jgi:predicted amidophosphoribosyltransferase
MIPGDVNAKVAFASSARTATAVFQQALERLKNLQVAFLARGYQAGGGDAILDADIVGAGITAEQLNQLLNSAWLVTRLTNLMAEQAVSGTIAGNSIMDRIRSDM